MENETIYPNAGIKTKILGLAFLIIAALMLNDITQSPFVSNKPKGCLVSELEGKPTHQALKDIPSAMEKCLLEHLGISNPFNNINWPKFSLKEENQNNSKD